MAPGFLLEYMRPLSWVLSLCLFAGSIDATAGRKAEPCRHHANIGNHQFDARHCDPLYRMPPQLQTGKEFDYPQGANVDADGYVLSNNATLDEEEGIGARLRRFCDEVLETIKHCGFSFDDDPVGEVSPWTDSCTVTAESATNFCLNNE